MDMKLLLLKIRTPAYAYWQKKYYRSVEEEDFVNSMKCLKKIAKHFDGCLPPFWALEVAKIRHSLGQYDKARVAIEELSESIDKSVSYNQDTKKYLFKQIERIHSEVLKAASDVTDITRMRSVRYIDYEEIDFSKVDRTFLEGWPLDS